MEENEEIESDKKDPNCLKITLIGDSGVGKTCIINRYAQNEFTENTDSTLGVGYKKKAFEFNGKTYQLYSWTRTISFIRKTFLQRFLYSYFGL